MQCFRKSCVKFHTVMDKIKSINYSSFKNHVFLDSVNLIIITLKNVLWRDKNSLLNSVEGQPIPGKRVKNLENVALNFATLAQHFLPLKLFHIARTSKIIGCIDQWLASYALKIMIPGSNPTANYMQKLVLCSISR